MRRIAIISAPYYKEETDALIANAKKVLTENGIEEDRIDVYETPGSFEIPLLCSAIAKDGSYDALIAFGIILQGETAHADHIAREVARALMDIQTQYQIPCAFGVQHVSSIEIARERCMGEKNRGRECAEAVLQSLAQLERLQS